MTESGILGALAIQAALAFILTGLLWFQTGRDPLYWIARWAIQARAAALQIGISARVGWVHFRANYAESEWQAAREVREGL